MRVSRSGCARAANEWGEGSEEHAKKYEEAREAAWTDLDDLLDLSGKKKAAPPNVTTPKKPLPS